MAIIGISGKIGSGKDTVGKIIQYLTAYGQITEDKSVEAVMKFLNATHPVFDDPFFYTSAQFGTSWEIKKFATKLKQMICLLTGCTMEQLENQDFKNTKLPPEWDWYKTIGSNNGKPVYLRSSVTEKIRQEMGERVYSTTYRELLQLLGTEALRNVIHEDVHVNALFADYKSLSDKKSYDQLDENQRGQLELAVLPNWIITDTRFPNEAQAIKNRKGILIRIERPRPFDHPTELGTGHPSETALDDYHKFDYILMNDGTIEDLIKKVKKILILEKIIQ
jgi:hypothetical protein